MSARSRIGLLGGTFDPVHAGHLDIARWCAEKLGLSEVRFLASNVPPHKPAAAAAACHRHAMLAIATMPFPGFVADPRELGRGGTTYTVDTLEELTRERPDRELVFLAGADSLRDLPTWRRHEDILRLATVAAVARDGLALEAAAAAVSRHVQEGRIVLLEHRPPPWSSTALRTALGSGPAPPGALPDGVADYIRKNRLYEARGAHAPAPGRNP